MRRALAILLLALPVAADDDFAKIKGLITRLGASDEQTRAQAAHDLGRLGSGARAATTALAKALGDESAWVADTARDALKAIGPDAVPALVKARACVGRSSSLKWRARWCCCLAACCLPEPSAIS